MNKEEASRFLARYLDGKCTPEEKVFLERFYMEEAGKRNLSVGDLDFGKAKTEIWEGVVEHTEEALAKTYRFNLGIRVAAAAVLLFTLSAGLYFYSYQHQKDHVQIVASNGKYKNDIAPGSQKAILTLANGEIINLSDADNGELAEQDGISITKTKNGQLVYNAQEAVKNNASQTSVNSIATPKGGTYLVVLPDGTKAWLNASSSIKFPAVFKGKERNVAITGEVYFEVAKSFDKLRRTRVPFIVDVNHMEKVEVLGTHFNIMAYDDENKIATTLLEGSVKVSNRSGATLIKPGQKAALNTLSGNIQVSAADLDEAVAWKNGDFIFNGEDLQSIMRKVSRWYNVEVVFKGTPDKFKYSGVVSRSRNVSAVLEMIESTKRVHFEIEGRRITVMN